MVLGACLDAGLPLDDLKQALGSLAVDGYAVSAERVLRAGVSATKFHVHEHAAASDRQPLAPSVPEHPGAQPHDHYPHHDPGHRDHDHHHDHDHHDHGHRHDHESHDHAHPHRSL